MKCSYVKIEGHPVILCGGRERIKACKTCGEIAGKLCDWKVSGGTCSEPICDEHAMSVGDDLDLCPTHAEAWAVHPANAQGELAL